MIRPMPVTAYAAVSPDGVRSQITHMTRPSAQRAAGRICAPGKRAPVAWEIAAGLGWTVEAVTIIPTEQYEAMVAIINEAQILVDECTAPGSQNEFIRSICEMTERLAALKEQDHG